MPSPVPEKLPGGVVAGNARHAAVWMGRPSPGHPRSLLEGIKGGEQRGDVGLLMGIIHDKDNFFSLHYYPDADEWQYAEVKKRL